MYSNVLYLDVTNNLTQRVAEHKAKNGFQNFTAAVMLVMK